MSKKENFTGHQGQYKEPERLDELHRPPGSAMAREIKSQKAQLQSEHDHGHDPAVKLGMQAKVSGNARQNHKKNK